MKLTLALATLAAMAIALPAVFPPPRAHTDHHPQGFQELRALNATNGSTVGVEKVGGTGVIERATMEAAGNKTCPPTYTPVTVGAAKKKTVCMKDVEKQPEALAEREVAAGDKDKKHPCEKKYSLADVVFSIGALKKKSACQKFLKKHPGYAWQGENEWLKGDD